MGTNSKRVKQRNIRGIYGKKDEDKGEIEKWIGRRLTD